MRQYYKLMDHRWAADEAVPQAHGLPVGTKDAGYGIGMDFWPNL